MSPLLNSSCAQGFLRPIVGKLFVVARTRANYAYLWRVERRSTRVTPAVPPFGSRHSALLFDTPLSAKARAF